MAKRLKLLKELKELGVHESGRKVRIDKGKTHDMTNEPRKVRTDKGTKRAKYNKHTPAFNRKIFETLISTNFNFDTGDDMLQRDDNGIFPPHITHHYKKVTKKGNEYSYKSSQRRANHPEQLRWRWWMSEYENSKGKERERWATHIHNWYFIVEADFLVWTYEEWAWAYYTQIAGHRNNPRLDDYIVLYYDHYLAGDYGRPERDENDDIIWRRD